MAEPMERCWAILGQLRSVKKGSDVDDHRITVLARDNNTTSPIRQLAHSSAVPQNYDRCFGIWAAINSYIWSKARILQKVPCKVRVNACNVVRTNGVDGASDSIMSLEDSSFHVRMA
jgi:hypothetical protein